MNLKQIVVTTLVAVTLMGGSIGLGRAGYLNARRDLENEMGWDKKIYPKGDISCGEFNNKTLRRSGQEFANKQLQNIGSTFNPYNLGKKWAIEDYIGHCYALDAGGII